MEAKVATFEVDRDAAMRGWLISRAEGNVNLNEFAIFVSDKEWQEFVETVMAANERMPESRKWT